MPNSIRSHRLQHVSLPCPSLSLGACSNSCPLSWWCHPTIWSSATRFSFHLWCFPELGSFPELALCMKWLKYWSFISASVFSINIQCWFPLGLLVWSPCSPRDSQITIWKHQFFSTQPSLGSNSQTRTRPLKNHSFDYWDICQQSDVSAFEYTV